MPQTNQQMKKLTKIRLINWHFFTDETIHVKGSVLFSGENASGKSTVLDAVQFVLTAGAGHFNPAANEKSKRDLRGYVRCKTGEEGNTYVRGSGAVISYVALEFYEESKSRYFVIGVKLDSPDPDADINKKWFCIEGPMDSLSFIVNGKPAVDREFTQNGRKVQFEMQVNRARENFKVRLGRLDDKFPEMISKSMAFKPMNRVKDFINQFILPERKIETGSLQENIRNLREMQQLINDVRQQIAALHKIVDKADEIESREYDALVIDILIRIAGIEAYEEKRRKLQQQKAEDEALLTVLNKQLTEGEKNLQSAFERLGRLNAALTTNECGRLIEKIENEIRQLENDKKTAQKSQEEYLRDISVIEDAVKVSGITGLSCQELLLEGTAPEQRSTLLEHIKQQLTGAKDYAYGEKTRKEIEVRELTEKAGALTNKISELKKNRMSYDHNTTMLRQAINDEFAVRKIDAKCYILADLLEIKLPQWRDAVEGYLNTQRFHIIVDPAYYDIAAGVYDRLKNKLHTVGLVNTAKLDTETGSDLCGTLAEAVQSDNRFARAYIDYILGRVIRCDSVAELKNHNIAITSTCMKYQGHVLSKISPDIYRNPYIGRYALEVQLKNAEAELAETVEKVKYINALLNNYRVRIEAIDRCNFNSARDRVDASARLKALSDKLQIEEKELSDAKNDPTYIDLSIKYDAAQKEYAVAGRNCDNLKEQISNKKRDISDTERSIDEVSQNIQIESEDKDRVAGGNLKACDEAEKKYRDEARRKLAGTIAANYGPRRQALNNQIESAKMTLVSEQTRYKDGDFGTGMEVIQLYRDDLAKLEKADLIAYEDKLAAAQKECELEFHENFLVRMKENIDNASAIFSELNKSLKDIYYGNDSYKFELGANRERRSLYDMITSAVENQSLFTAQFEENYHAEMEDLFSKLTDESLADSAAIKELTDYRSYLDYDIQVISRDGRMQRFSKTYGEKSGGETQTPYYVAIAASFAQMYSGRETARLVMLDEAFNNMDEDRIESMMKFFDSQNFQIIFAAPPVRMEIIGEHVESIYLAIRIPHKNISTIEEYFL